MLIAFIGIAGSATHLSYLRPAFTVTRPWIYALAWLAWLGLFIATRDRTSDAPAGHALALLLAAALFAFLFVTAINLALLLGVRYGRSEQTEFHSEITRTRQTESCSHLVTFFDEPLGRNISLCGDYPPLLQMQAGDRIVVHERVGAMGGSVVRMERAP